MSGRALFHHLYLELLGRLLRPAVRFCLCHAIDFRQFLEKAKRAFIELAAEEILQGQGKATVSRISVMTGIHRRDVAKIYEQGEAIGVSLSVVVRVLGQWQQDLRFLTKAGQPRVLTFRGKESEFQKLVGSVSKDVNPAAVLAELERLGNVEHVSTGIKLVKDVLYYHRDPAEGLALLSEDVETLVTAVEENLFEPQDRRNLHLRTDYDNIFRNDLPVIRDWLLRQGAALHKKARIFISQFDKDLNPGINKEGGATVVLHSFSWTTKHQANSGREPKSR